MKHIWAEQVLPKKEKKKDKKKVNGGRVRRVTFRTGTKVVESAGVVRVK